MGPGEKKPQTSFGEQFTEAFEKAMTAEHEEHERMPEKYAPDAGVVDVVEPEGEKHFEP